MEKIVCKIIAILLAIISWGCSNDDNDRINALEGDIYAIDITEENAPFTHIFAHSNGYVIYANINTNGIPQNAIVRFGEEPIVIVFKENGEPYQIFYNNKIYVLNNISSNKVDFAIIEDNKPISYYYNQTFDERFSDFGITESLDISRSDMTNDIDNEIIKLRIKHGVKFLGNAIGISACVLSLSTPIGWIGLGIALVGAYNDYFGDSIGVGYGSAAAGHILSIAQFVNPTKIHITLAGYAASNFSLLSNTLELKKKKKDEIKEAETVLKKNENKDSIENIIKKTNFKNTKWNVTITGSSTSNGHTIPISGNFILDFTDEEFYKFLISDITDIEDGITFNSKAKIITPSQIEIEYSVKGSGLSAEGNCILKMESSQVLSGSSKAKSTIIVEGERFTGSADIHYSGIRIN